MSKLIKHTTVKALFVKDGLVFIVKDGATGTWELPGGKIDNNDSVEATLRRELKEELNLDKVDIGPQINNFEFSVVCYGKKYIFNVLVYIVHADLSKIVLSDEHTSFEWVSYKEIEKYPMQEEYKKIISMLVNKKN